MKLFLAFAACIIAVVLSPSAIQAAGNPYQGRLVKSPSSTAVYYVGLDQKRHAFPNQKVYFSWYPNFSDVEIISDFELSLYPLGENVLYRPGARLIKIPDVSEVYAVLPGGRLRNVVSEEAAISLYGPNWAKKVDDIDISFFFDYEIEGVIDVVNEHAVFPQGTLVNFDGSNYLVDKRTDGIFTLRPVTPTAFTLNRFELLERQIISDPSLREFFEIGLPVTTAEPAYSCPSCPSSYFQRDSIAQTIRAASPNQKYRFDLPTAWGAAFPVDGDMVSQALEIEARDIARSFSVYRYRAADYEGLVQNIIDEQMLEYGGAEVVYEGPSLFSAEGYDTVVMIADAFENDVLVYWNRYLVKGDDMYHLQFATPGHQLYASVDVLETFLRTFQVDQTIL